MDKFTAAEIGLWAQQHPDPLKAVCIALADVLNQRQEDDKYTLLVNKDFIEELDGSSNGSRIDRMNFIRDIIDHILNGEHVFKSSGMMSYSVEDHAVISIRDLFK